MKDNRIEAATDYLREIQALAEKGQMHEDIDPKFMIRIIDGYLDMQGKIDHFVKNGLINHEEFERAIEDCKERFEW